MFIIILVLGSLGYLEKYNYFFFNEKNNFEVLNFFNDFVYHGMDWLYSSTYMLGIFNFKIVFYMFSNFIFDDFFDFFFFFFWFFSLFFSSYQLFFSFFLDFYLNFLNISFPFFDYWYRFVLCNKEFSLFFIYHPEMLYVSNNIFGYFFFFFGNVYINIFNQLLGDFFFSFFFFFFQIFFFFFFFFFFFWFYFS